MIPDLSIIIPTLNESEALPLLLADLGRQQGLSFEVIVSDGGSKDTTCQLTRDLFALGQLSGDCLVGPSGRGRQLNAGATVANSEWLLFLHADSRMHDVNQLSRALDFMRSQEQLFDSDALSGRFLLRFDSPNIDREVGLFYYETKAALGRPGCIHGDQGLMIKKSFFRQLGSYREDLPVMEDTWLAEIIRTKGQWHLMPGEIVTSARRFEVEGLKARQTLNALMMNFLSIGWLEFFSAAPEIYRQQDRAKPLKLMPFFELIRTLLNEMTFRDRCNVWLATGAYVRSQAWQIGLALDCRRVNRRADSAATLSDGWLNWFDRWFDPLTNHGVGRLLTALLVRGWFAYQLTRKDDNCMRS